jgi:hypothetical protein
MISCHANCGCFLWLSPMFKYAADELEVFELLCSSGELESNSRVATNRETVAKSDGSSRV